MTIQELHFQFKFLIDKVSNNHVRSLTDLDIDTILNRAIYEYVEMFFHGRNNKGYQIGFEVNQQMIDMLDTLVREKTEIAVSNNQCSLPSDYRNFIEASVETDCGTLNVNIEQHGDTDSVKNSFHRKASSVFKNMPTLQRNKKLIFLNDSITINSVNLVYLKKPNEVCLGTYAAYGQSSIKPKVECDINSDYHPLLLDIAKAEWSRIYENVNSLNIQKDKIQTI